MDSDTVLTTTRSVRLKLDLDRRVDDEVIRECLRIAQQAPAAGALAASLRWIVVQDAHLRARIAEPVRRLGLAALQQYGDLSADPRMKSARHLLDVIDRVPVLILAAMLGAPGDTNGERSAFYGSAYPAIWSMQLALRSRGLGSTLALHHLMGGEQEVAEALNIPEGVSQIALLAVAHTTTADFHPAKRPALEDVAFADSWGHAL
jgi:nitroreductase